MEAETDFIRNSILGISPILRKRANGGTLAITPPTAYARFAVTADDDDRAIAAFTAAKYSWASTLSSEQRRTATPTLELPKRERIEEKA